MAISDAVGLERISRIVGYKLVKGDFSETSPNLPQRIAIFAEANTANQGTVDFSTPLRITSAQVAGQTYGWGSPMHIISRILFPNNGGGSIGGIPVYAYPQAEAVGAAAKVRTIAVTGTATAGGTHYVVVGGRYALDGGSYAVNIAAGDTNVQVATKIYNVINNVLGCPVTAALASPATGTITTTTKWKGLTANGVNITIDTNGDTLGLSYGLIATVPGTGTPTVDASLALFGNTWNTIVINSYGFVNTVLSSLQTYNGIPDPTTPTGRYAATIFKPFIALTGTVENSDASTPDTLNCDGRKTQVTIAACPAPLSAGLAMEAAANMCALFARVCQDTPQLDVEGLSYPDMPVATVAPTSSSYDVRDALVQMGMSTVDIVSGAYQVQDFVTTYHPVGEVPPQFRYCRNLNLDFNVRYGYYLLEQQYVIGFVIAADADVVTASRVVKPKNWKSVLFEYAKDLTTRALVADTKFMQSSIVVGIGSSNPDRLETFFRYKRTGTVRIASTTAEAGFNFGNA